MPNWKNFTLRLQLTLPALSICLGLILSLRGDEIGGDAVSYLDMGDYFFAGHHRAILNGL